MKTASRAVSNELHQLAEHYSFRIEENGERLRIYSFFNWTSYADLGQLILFLLATAALIMSLWYYENHLGFWVTFFLSGTLSVVLGLSLISQISDFVEIDTKNIRWRCGEWKIRSVPLQAQLKLRIDREDGVYHSRKYGAYYYRDLLVYLIDGEEEYCLISLTVDQKEKHRLDQFIKPISSKIKARLQGNTAA